VLINWRLDTRKKTRNDDDEAEGDRSSLESECVRSGIGAMFGPFTAGGDIQARPRVSHPLKKRDDGTRRWNVGLWPSRVPLFTMGQFSRDILDTSNHLFRRDAPQQVPYISSIPFSSIEFCFPRRASSVTLIQHPIMLMTLFPCG
jgi:hypothetical protein